MPPGTSSSCSTFGKNVRSRQANSAKPCGKCILLSQFNEDVRNTGPATEREEQQPNSGPPRRGRAGDTDTQIGIRSLGEIPCIRVLILVVKFREIYTPLKFGTKLIAVVLI